MYNNRYEQPYSNSEERYPKFERPPYRIYSKQGEYFYIWKLYISNMFANVILYTHVRYYFSLTGVAPPKTPKFRAFVLIYSIISANTAIQYQKIS